MIIEKLLSSIRGNKNISRKFSINIYYQNELYLIIRDIQNITSYDDKSLSIIINNFNNLFEENRDTFVDYIDSVGNRLYYLIKDIYGLNFIKNKRNMYESSVYFINSESFTYSDSNVPWENLIEEITYEKITNELIDKLKHGKIAYLYPEKKNNN